MPGVAGRSGRKRIPTKLKEITGTNQKCRSKPKFGLFNPNSKQPRSSTSQDYKTPTAPKWLTKDQKTLYRSMAKSVKHLNVPKPEHADDFARLVHAVHQYRNCVKDLAVEPHGATRKMMMVEMKSHRDYIRGNVGKYGLDPTAVE